MKHIDISKLIKYQAGEYKGKIDWRNNIGKYVPFIYDNITGKVKIISYIPDIPIASIMIEYEGKTKIIKINMLKKGCIGNLIGRFNYDYLYDINQILNTTDGYSQIKIKQQTKVSHARSLERTYWVECLNCHYEYSVREVNISSCPHCSDRISYGHKFMISLLKQLNIQFETEKIFNWSGLKRYDLYIPENDIVIEVNGLEHYEPASFDPNMTKEEYLKYVQDNDKEKYQLATLNRITNYIVIDAKCSTKDYIKHSILNSSLINFYNLYNIDWDECDKFATKSFIKTASEMWSNNISIDIISKELNRSPSTIIIYLRKGNELGYCVYDKHTNHVNGHKNSNYSNCKSVICITTREIFNSQQEATKYYNIYKSGVSDCCRGHIPSAGKHPITKESLVWEYYNT